MTGYDSPEMGEKAEIKESLRVLSLRRLGYDFADDQLLLEGERADLESLAGYKTGLFDLPVIDDVSDIEGAMIGAAGHVFVARSLLGAGDRLIQQDKERLGAIAKNVAAVMRHSFKKVYPDLLEDADSSENMLWGFQMDVRDGGIPTFVTFGQCACLGYDPYGMGLGLPTEELSFHNIDSRSNEQLGRAQLTSLFAGLAVYSDLIKSEG